MTKKFWLKNIWLVGIKQHHQHNYAIIIIIIIIIVQKVHYEQAKIKLQRKICAVRTSYRATVQSV